jgi:hypothetical protein
MSHMSHSAHYELISTLTELYTLLDTLAAISPNTLRLPPAYTGVHPTFNAEAAREGGYSPEAVEALSKLPYVYGGALVGLSTCTNYYLGPNRDGEDFEQDREMMYYENLALPSAIQLTGSEGGYGCIYVYDAETRPLIKLCYHNHDSKLTITLRAHLPVDAHVRPAHRRYQQRGNHRLRYTLELLPHLPDLPTRSPATRHRQLPQLALHQPTTITRRPQ